MERVHRELEIINRNHFLATSLQGYVRDTGKFPDSLEVLAAALKLDAGVIGPLHDERIDRLQTTRS